MTVAGFFNIAQGLSTISIFSQILKEYKQAENGETNGIRMTRKSKHMTLHRQQIKKICMATVCLGFVAYLTTTAMANDVIKQSVHAQYKL